MRRLTLMLLAGTLLLAGVLTAAPAQAQAGPMRALASAATDPLVGNWYRGKMWFRVRAPLNGVYKVAWSNGHGSMIHYTIKRWSSGVYYETANHHNTYKLINGYTVKIHYKTTSGSYVTRNFARVG